MPLRTARMCLWGLAALAAAQPAANASDTPFSIGIEMPCQVPVTPAVESALRDMGIDYINYYVKPWTATPEEEAVAANREMMAFTERMDLDFALSCYVADPPETAVREAVAAGPRFKGIVFDELAHCRLLNLHEGTEPLADPAALHDLPQAYGATLNGYRRLYERFAALGAPVTATHVWPVLHHVSARAGFNPCPKICKEFYSPISLAIGLGAALQYGRELTVDCDLWYYDLVPGHTPEEFKSNLLLAYWLGADRLYVEGSGHNLTEVGKQGIPFSLMTQITPERYQLTAHGEVLRWFTESYLPAHPRPWTFRDITPDVAIVRFPDSCYGQTYVEDGGWDWHAGLYGAKAIPSTEDTRAWFGLWNLLTCGVSGHDGITFFSKYIAAAGYERPVKDNLSQSLYSRPVQADSHRFFVPLRGVVVFDHLAGYEHLKDIPVICLTGVAVSDSSMAAVRRRVEEGATCVIWGNLARKLGFTDYGAGYDERPYGQGKFVLTDDFSKGRVWQTCWPQMARPDEIDYRFGANRVVLKRVTDNEVDVRIVSPDGA